MTTEATTAAVMAMSTGTGSNCPEGQMDMGTGCMVMGTGTMATCPEGQMDMGNGCMVMGTGTMATCPEGMMDMGQGCVTMAMGTACPDGQMDMGNGCMVMGTGTMANCPEGQMDMGNGCMAMGSECPAGEMDMGNGCMAMGDDGMMMQMSFNTDLPVTVLFDGWKIDNTSKMIGSCFGILGIAILYELLKHGRQVFMAWYYPASPSDMGDDDCCDAGVLTAYKDKSGTSKFSISKFLAMHTINSLWHLLMATIGYFLMLITMTYNVYLFISVVIGLAIGFFITGVHVALTKSNSVGSIALSDTTNKAGKVNRAVSDHDF